MKTKPINVLPTQMTDHRPTNKTAVINLIESLSFLCNCLPLEMKNHNLTKKKKKTCQFVGRLIKA
jgi:hypothetical protein